MSEAAPYLTDVEVAELTGYVQPKRQARWLAQQGIKPMINARGKVRVLRDALTVNRPGRAKTEPNFTGIRRTG
jgi:hypothetical protein